jgi:hypothetical protein
MKIHKKNTIYHKKRHFHVKMALKTPFLYENDPKTPFLYEKTPFYMKKKRSES